MYRTSTESVAIWSPQSSQTLAMEATTKTNMKSSTSTDCPICLLPFSTRDLPIRLNTPCQHVFGRTCLEQWISSDRPNANTCPLCREVLFDLREAVVRKQQVDNGERGLKGLVIDSVAEWIGKGLLMMWRS
ncbi:hypothetical protein BDV96DRAFT_45220 [Lophiotrema nucula]|uniref:RING-type domain-containing protein n=1 Tax=Lophiotrema nucula TaxID=690887 RepID=A0A6A5ZBV0_9PLEO|nr:hypothetical protein BDV96DRAFT_45220 [Lophiotrema nucula]